MEHACNALGSNSDIFKLCKGHTGNFCFVKYVIYICYEYPDLFHTYKKYLRIYKIYKIKNSWINIYLFLPFLLSFPPGKI